MNNVFRVLAGMVGVFFLLSGIRWIADPGGAAATIGLPLLEGIALSSQIGDVGAFFFVGGLMALLGVWKQKAEWYLAPALLLLTAALFRVLATLVHGADLAAPFIGFEVICGAILLMAARAAE